MFNVYRAYGGISDTSYYGYCEGDPKETFIKQAHKRTEYRGDVGLLNDNENNINNITFTTISEHEDEEDAWMERNDLRAANDDAITGPTYWPGIMNEKAEKKDPQRVERWRKSVEWKKCATARKAYAAGKWTIDQIKQLCVIYPKKEVAKDLDVLTPTKFELKYFCV